MRTTETQRRELAELEAKATPAPWKLRTGQDGRRSILTSMSHPLAEFSHAGHRQIDGAEGLDPELAVAARNALPDLLADLDEAVEVIHNLHEFHDDCTPGDLCQWCEAYRAGKEGGE